MDRQADHSQPSSDVSVLCRADNAPAQFVLNDGTVYSGFSFGANTSVSGECVFQTGTFRQRLSCFVVLFFSWYLCTFCFSACRHFGSRHSFKTVIYFRLVLRLMYLYCIF
jgi:hypothetical protein